MSRLEHFTGIPPSPPLITLTFYSCYDILDIYFYSHYCNLFMTPGTVSFRQCYHVGSFHGVVIHKQTLMIPLPKL